MISKLLRLTLAAALGCWSLPALAQNAASMPPDPNSVLAEAKAASGGAAWDRLRTQHSTVTISAVGLSGTAERWSDIATGRSVIRYSIGPIDGAAGYDGKAPWSQDASGLAHVETADDARELAVNAAYRDQFAFWYPERAPAHITYKERVTDDGAEFDVVRIAPEGGRPFELWVNTETKLFERLVERDAQGTRTEYYMDLHDVQGVKIPFRVRATRGDPRQDEVVVVDRLEYNAPLAGVSFAVPAAPKPDFAFPAGRASVDVPFTIHDGHLYVPVMLNGKGPFRMLLDASAASVLLPGTAAALGLTAEGSFGGTGTGENRQDVGITRVERVDIGGVAFAKQPFTAIDIGPYMRRVEGLDDVAGVLGYELFRRFPIRLDYQHARATFYDPARFASAGHGEPVPFRFRDRMPEVEGSVDGFKGLFDLDTAGRGSLSLTAPFVQRNDFVARFGATREVVTGAGVDGHTRSLVARAGVFRLGPVEIKRPVVALATPAGTAESDTDLAGTVGFGILRQFNITFDYPNRVLYLEKNDAFGKPDSTDRSGMWIERGETGYEVVDVLQDGPAAAAGIHAGDVIVAINGKPWSAVPLPALRLALKAPPGGKVRLKLDSGREWTLTLRDLV
jgi:hypothetical protein